MHQQQTSSSSSSSKQSCWQWCDAKGQLSDHQSRTDAKLCVEGSNSCMKAAAQQATSSSSSSRASVQHQYRWCTYTAPTIALALVTTATARHNSLADSSSSRKPPVAAVVVLVSSSTAGHAPDHSCLPRGGEFVEGQTVTRMQLGVMSTIPYCSVVCNVAGR